MKKSKSKQCHAYRVAFHQWDQVTVTRYEVSSYSKVSVTYINEYGIEFTLDKKGVSYRWFKTKEKAKAFAVKKLNERIEHYSQLVFHLKSQAKRILKTK